MDFARKYEGVDIKMIDAATVDDVEECDWLMKSLDDIIGHMEAQIDLAKMYAKSKAEYSDPVWFTAVHRACKGAKTNRNSMQMRRGVLRKAHSRLNSRSRDAAFVAAAKAILRSNTVAAIWEKARADNPELGWDGLE